MTIENFKGRTLKELALKIAIWKELNPQKEIIKYGTPRKNDSDRLVAVIEYAERSSTKT